ncbi:unnamed protein product [Symbiodinium natans]|uniref:Uncharacterized protein n=1 Tax=Symbiodinium natans TaxID=878477 RepID=A0A812LCW5_9DINO|nr:unnamed protein product [Symbiodinium natans]
MASTEPVKQMSKRAGQFLFCVRALIYLEATEELILSWFPKGHAFAKGQFNFVICLDRVNIVQAKDPGTTGNFEITVNGKLVHSKKTQQQGFFESAPKVRQWDMGTEE